MDITFLKAINVIICIICCYYHLSKIKKKLSFLSAIIIVFVITNGLAIGFLPGSEVAIENSFYTDDEVTSTAIICMIIFIGISFLFEIFKILKISKKRLFCLIRQNKLSYRLTKFFWFFLLLVTLGAFRFILLSKALRISELGYLIFSWSKNSYYAYRFSLEVLPGSGFASLTLNCIAPTLFSVVLIVFFGKGNKSKVPKTASIILIFLSFIMLVYSVIFAQRMGIIYALSFPLAAWVLNRNSQDKFKDFNKDLKRRIKKMASFFFATGLLILIATFIFSVFTEKPFGEAFIVGIFRFIAVPAGTNNYYYHLFPKILDFTGIQNFMSLTSSGLDYSDIARFSTGIAFTANASFIAISYSSFGFLGVILASIVFCLIGTWHDVYFDTLDTQFKRLILAASFTSIMALSSASLLSAVGSFGLFLATFIVRLSVKGVSPDFSPRFS
jgi:hypothetical protein